MGIYEILTGEPGEDSDKLYTKGLFVVPVSGQNRNLIQDYNAISGVPRMIESSILSTGLSNTIEKFVDRKKDNPEVTDDEKRALEKLKREFPLYFEGKTRTSFPFFDRKRVSYDFSEGKLYYYYPVPEEEFELMSAQVPFWIPIVPKRRNFFDSGRPLKGGRGMVLYELDLDDGIVREELVEIDNSWTYYLCLNEFVEKNDLRLIRGVVKRW